LTQNRSSSSLNNRDNYGGGGYNSSSYHDEPSSNSYQSYGGFSSEQIKSQKEDFFSRKQAENMSRPE
jgi:hypothetical protein